jgi:hypothetical protein
MRYATLTADAGTIIHKPFLLTFLVSTAPNVKPFLLSVWDNFKGDIDSYKKLIALDVQECECHGIVVAGTVTDHCSVQVSAVSHASKKSLFKDKRMPPRRGSWSRSLIDGPMLSELQGERAEPRPEGSMASAMEDLRQVLASPLLSSSPRAAARWIGCACHSAGLALSDLEKSNGDFATMVNQVKEASEFLHGKPIRSRLGKCGGPTYCKTRWTNVLDIAFWIAKHREELLDFTLNFPKSFETEGVLEGYLNALSSSKYLLTLLAPYGELVHVYSGDHTPAAHILLLLESACILTKELVQRHCPAIESIANDFISHLIARFRGSFASGKDSSLLQLLNLLCPAGRNRFRQKVAESPPDSGPETDPQKKPARLEGEEPRVDCRIPKVEIDAATMKLIEKDDGVYESKVVQVREFFAAAPPARTDSVGGAASGSEHQMETRGSRRGRDPEGLHDALHDAVRQMEREPGRNAIDGEFLEEEEEEAGPIRAPKGREEESDEDEEEDEEEEEEEEEEKVPEVQFSLGDIVPLSALREAAKELKELMDDLELEGEEKRRAVGHLKWWVLHAQSPDVLRTFASEDLLVPWAAQQFTPYAAEMCEIALRLLSIVSSEATCERGFWYLRRTLAPHRMNSSRELLLARLRAQMSFDSSIPKEFGAPNLGPK